MASATSMINLTKELLSLGVFNHLPDEELSCLQRLVMQLQIAPGITEINPLICYWYKGDYYNYAFPVRLLQKCNEHLQQMHKPMIEMYSEEFVEI